MKKKLNQKGAALVTVILMTLVLLTACIGLLLESSMNSMNVTDALSEQQAYTAAESGLQAAINVLRGNKAPVDPASPPNKINYIKAVNPAISNYDADPAGYARLSRWLNYSYTPTGGTAPDRVPIGNSYDPASGFAYSVRLEDPDNTGDSVTFGTQGIFRSGPTVGATTGAPLTVQGITYSFTPKTTTTLAMPTGSGTTDFGTLQIVNTNTSDITLTENLRFDIFVYITAPYQITEVMRGFIPKGTVIKPTLQGLKVYFTSAGYEVMGSEFKLTGYTKESATRFAFDYGATPAGLVLNGTMTPIEPYRIKLTSTGYGPRGAKKVVEAVIIKNFLTNLAAPAPLLLIGPSTGATFKPGRSQQITYSGVDAANPTGDILVPPIGTTNDENLQVIENGMIEDKNHPDVIGYPANVSAEIPYWLDSPLNLEQQAVAPTESYAKSIGRYFEGNTKTTDFGDYLTGKGVTFIDGNATLAQDGGGVLIVTGTLTLKGNFNFRGLIIVIGSGGVKRDGAGTGTIEGNLIISAYDRNQQKALLADNDETNDDDLDFLAPQYDVDGGGNSEIKYNSNTLANGLEAMSNIVMGVAEK